PSCQAHASEVRSRSGGGVPCAYCAAEVHHRELQVLAATRVTRLVAVRTRAPTPRVSVVCRGESFMKHRAGLCISVATLAVCAGLAQAQSFTQNFEGGVLPAGWAQLNHSVPLGGSTWNVTNAAGFGAHLGTFHV